MKFIALALFLSSDLVLCQQSVYPKEFYAFPKASTQLDKPPKVRKPPYISSNIECSGLNKNRLSPKDTLCGDLNTGIIPKNPMGHNLFGQPYPFEIIKNKTLHFLANALPILKQRMHTIPKVAKLSKTPDSFENHLSHRRRFVREIKNNSDLGLKLFPNSEQNTTELLRQNICEGNSICQAIDALRQDGPFSKSFLSNVVSAMSNAATIGNIASVVNQYTNQLTDSPQNNNFDKNNGNKSAISQVLSTLSTISDSNTYNPLISIIDYISSFQNSNKFPSRRRKPLEPEDLLPEPTGEQSSTPCQAIDEYITPTYARNYQGVWKYVVQIPSEGYFTQTIQRTSCLKSKCDFVEGVCSESSRWVSLLVAEIFYPDVYFPVSAEQPLNYRQTLNNQIISVKNNHKLKTKIRPLNNIHSDKYQTFAEDLRRMDRSESPPPREHMTPRNGRRISGKPSVQELSIPDEELVSKVSKLPNKECDGYDKIGCFVIRVYYDWFLVNGSCKCWTAPKQTQYNSINEAIKRIFIGKW